MSNVRGLKTNGPSPDENRNSNKAAVYRNNNTQNNRRLSSM